MTSTRQFWTLFKLQPSINPVIFFIPIVFSTPLLMPFLLQSPYHYHPSLSSLLSNQNTFFVLFFAIIWLAPELSGTGNAKWTNGTEFFVTRAIDRPLLYRARLALFYIGVLVIPFILICEAIAEPYVQISEYDSANQKELIAHLPGSTLVPKEGSTKSTEILIPNGSLLVRSFNLWAFLLWAIGSQLFISLIISLKYRKYILWGIFALVVGSPLLTMSSARSSLRSTDSNQQIDTMASFAWDETLFLQFIHYQPIIWLATAIALILVHLWCERRFARAEY